MEDWESAHVALLVERQDKNEYPGWTCAEQQRA
jgi:hypothetical protein